MNIVDNGKYVLNTNGVQQVPLNVVVVSNVFDLVSQKTDYYGERKFVDYVKDYGEGTEVEVRQGDLSISKFVDSYMIHCYSRASTITLNGRVVFIPGNDEVGTMSLLNSNGVLTFIGLSDEWFTISAEVLHIPALKL